MPLVASATYLRSKDLIEEEIYAIMGFLGFFEIIIEIAFIAGQ